MEFGAKKKTILNGLTLNEKIDMTILDKLIKSDLLLKSSWRSFSNERQQLIQYKNHLLKNNYTIEYKRSKGLEWGRVMPNHGLGLTCIRKEIRQTLLKNKMVDIDVVNCHPTILYQYCNAKGYKCSYLKKYCTKRDSIMTELTEHYGSAGTIKTLFIALINGASHSNIVDCEPHPFVEKFSKEIKKISQLIIDDCPKLTKDIEKMKDKEGKKDFNKLGSVMSYFLQTIECQILETIYSHCVDNNVVSADTNCILCYDGIMIDKDRYDDSLLTEFNEIVKNKFGFDLKFITKDMNLDLLDVLDEHVKEENLNVVYSDEEAAMKVLKMYPHWVFCEDVLFVYNFDSGMWDSDHHTHLSIIQKFKEYLYVPDVKGNPSKKSYGNTLSLMEKIPVLIKTQTKNDQWIQQNHKSGLKKVLFNNGYFDMVEYKFHSKKDFKPEIVFFNKIYYDWKESTNDLMDELFNKLFITPLDKEVGFDLLLNFSRGLAGDLMKKFILGLGGTNSGKSLLTKAVTVSCGGYASSFNAENLAYSKSSSDEAQKNRWALLLRFSRLLFSNEMNMKTQLNGNFMKKHSSGGEDSLIGRVHGGLESSFVPHYLVTVFANDLPSITPCDDALTTRLRVYEYTKTFVDKDEDKLDEEYELKMDTKLSALTESLEYKRGLINLLFRTYHTFLVDNEGIQNEPEAIFHNKAKWIDSAGDPITKFLESYEITNNEDDFITSKDVEGWIQRQELDMSYIKFTNLLKRHCLEKKYKNVLSKQVRQGSKRVRTWTGIKEIDD